MTAPTLASVDGLVAIIERAELDGLHFQHVALCRRRAWFHLHRLRYDHLDERMRKGTVMHEHSKARDKSIEGLMGLAPDRIDWATRTVYEAKGSAGAADAVSRQNAFYALLMWAAQRKPWLAVTDLIASRRTRPIAIDQDMVDSMTTDALDLEHLKKAHTPPVVRYKPLCGKCSFQRLCGAP
jgi:CRISPR-associated exonuclease Cas4